MPLHALFIDDDAGNRRVIRDMLTMVGVDLAEAPDALTGLSKVDAEDYDVLLTDLRMPGMDGLATICAVRGRDDAKRTVPIIVVTADDRKGVREDCMSIGANAFLWKPVSMQSLLDALGAAIAASGSTVLQ